MQSGSTPARAASAQLVADSVVGPHRSPARLAALFSSGRSSIHPVTGPGANPSRRGRACAAARREGVEPQKNVASIAVAVVPQFGVQLPGPGRWFSVMAVHPGRSSSRRHRPSLASAQRRFHLACPASLSRSGTASRRTAPACATGGTPSGRSSPPGSPGALRLPRFFSCRCSHAFTAGNCRIIRHAASLKAHFRWRVADLLAARPLHLAGTLVLAAHQPAYDRKLPGLGEAGDVVDLVEQDQPQDRADAGDGPQQAEGDRVVDLGVLHQVPFQLGDLRRRSRRSGPGRRRRISRVLGSAKRSSELGACGWRRR